jgi:hypothetical protein
MAEEENAISLPGMDWKVKTPEQISKAFDDAFYCSGRFNDALLTRGKYGLEGLLTEIIYPFLDEYDTCKSEYWKYRTILLDWCEKIGNQLQMLLNVSFVLALKFS